MNVKIKKGLKKAVKTIQRYAVPSTYEPFYPLPTKNSDMECLQKKFSNNEEDWDTYKSTK